MTSQTHWENVYHSRAADEVSWYQHHLETSLALIDQTVSDKSAAVIDIGGGESTLVDDLLSRGYTDVHVLDISAAALAAAGQRIGAAAQKIEWLVADITEVNLPAHRYDIWHDRAVFHFLTSAVQRVAYIQRVRHSVKPGGHVIVATFGPEGSDQCSGLDVARYDADELHREFGSDFLMIDSLTELHATPSGAVQQFLYCRFKLV